MVTLLLSQNNNPENQWDKAIRALELNVANQEKAARELKKERKRILRANKDLRKHIEISGDDFVPTHVAAIIEDEPIIELSTMVEATFPSDQATFRSTLPRPIWA